MFAKEASRFQCTCWEKHDITEQPVNAYVFDGMQPLNLFFFKPSNWNVRQEFENLCTMVILSYADCWCLVHFSCNISCDHSHKARLCYGWPIKTESYICVTILLQGVHNKKILLWSTLSCRRSYNRNAKQGEWGLLPRTAEVRCTADIITRQWKTAVSLAMTTNRKFRRLQTGCETAIHEVHTYIIG